MDINQQARVIKARQQREDAARQRELEQRREAELRREQARQQREREQAAVCKLALSFRRWAVANGVEPSGSRRRKGWYVASYDTPIPDDPGRMMTGGSVYLWVSTKGVVEGAHAFRFEQVEEGIARWVARTGVPWPD